MGTGPHLVVLDRAASTVVYAPGGSESVLLLSEPPVDCCSSIFSSGSHHLNYGVCFCWLRVSITSFRTSFALLLQHFESAVPTGRRADSLDIDCFADNWRSFLKNKTICSIE